jgi:tetratricopeptide (TPR) repeat protein
VWALLLTLTQDPASLYARGVELYNNGRIEEAVEALSKAAALASNVPDYRYHLGLAYLKLGKPKEAARELEGALGMMGVSRETRVLEPKVLVQLAIAYLRLSNVATARKRIELALSRGEDTAEARYVLGLVESASGNEAAAVEQFRAALERDRDHPEASFALAKRLEAEGKIAEAQETLAHAFHDRRPTFEIAMAFGDLSFRVNDLEAARDAFDAARALAPGDDRASYNLATVYLALAKPAEAVELLRPLVEREDPHDAAAFNLAEAYRTTGALAAARDLLRALLGRQPGFPGASFALGMTLDALGDLPGAEAAYRAAVSLKGDDLGPLLNLASVLERLGRVDEARGFLEQALALPLDENQARAIREAIEALSPVRS